VSCFGVKVSSFALIFGLTALSLSAQEANPAPAGQPAADATDPASGSVREGVLSRWLAIDDFSFSARYRNTYDTAGARIFDDGQERSLIKGKLKLDHDGKYFIGFRVSSGHYFNWAYSNFAGLNYGSNIQAVSSRNNLELQGATLNAYFASVASGQKIDNLTASNWSMYVRDLYLSATPVSFLTLEYGAIPVERGASTEITSFDDDGYISGGRVRIKAPKALWIDEFVATFAYFGDITTPNLFDRGNRFLDNNYNQFLAEKHFAKRFDASADLTRQIGTSTFREALRVSAPELRVVDSARVELYQRTNSMQLPGYLAPAANGWAVAGTKKIQKKVTLEVGYADIDDAYGVYSGSGLNAVGGFSLNGDAYQIGKRIFTRASYQPVPYFNFFGFYTHELNAEPNPLHATFNRQGLNAGMTIDFKSILGDKLKLF
jgi:hypothetical protein